MSSDPDNPGREIVDGEWRDVKGYELDILLDRVEAFCRRFVSYPVSHAAIAHVLWIAHTHGLDAFESSPRFAFLSPEAGSGKTRGLEITETLVPRPVLTVSATPAYLIRKVSSDEGRPVILQDEADTVWGAKAKDNEEIRGLYNAGHRRSGVAGRCTPAGNKLIAEEYPAFCAVAFAGLNDLPETIMSRSIVARMKRRAPNEKVEAFRARIHEPEGNQLRDELATAVGEIEEMLQGAWPEMPDGVSDRDADVWEPLLAIADAAGGQWPERARVAAVALVSDAKGKPPTLGVRLLADIRHVFGDRDQLPTKLLIEDLIAIDESPWGDLRGKPMDPRSLARMLSRYEISSKTIRMEASTPKGYARSDFEDAWKRYLSPLVSEEPATAATSATSEHDRGSDWVPGDE